MRQVHAQKNELKPWLEKQWVIPPGADAEFVCAMEDVLEVYTRPRDPARPVVCLDECSKQLVAETRAPLPAEPGRAERHDYEYERRGSASLFIVPRRFRAGGTSRRRSGARRWTSPRRSGTCWTSTTPRRRRPCW